MASKTGICNMALSHLGIGKELANVDTDTDAASAACRRYFDDCRDAILRDFAWPFATKIAALDLIEEDPNAEWAFSYRYPTDCLEVRKLLSGVRNDTRQTRVVFKGGQDASGRILFTDKQNAEAEYTVRTTDPQFFSSDFILSFSFRLAGYIAPRVTGGDPFKLGERALRLYEIEIDKARANAANEEETQEPPQAEWVRNR